MIERRMRSILRQLNERPRSRDALGAIAYLLTGVALLQFGGYRLWADVALIDEPAAFLVLLGAMSLLAVWRSTRPFLVLLLGTGLAVCDLLLGSSFGVILLLGDFVYCAFRYGGDRGVRALLWGILALTVVAVLTLVVWFRGSGVAAAVSLQWALTVMIGGLWGWNVRSERVSTRTAMALRHAQETERLRRRIAHDLHDHVANHIAVAGLHIEAARLRGAREERLPGAAAQSLEKATQGTDEAHRRLRQLIAVLTTIDGLEQHPLSSDGSLDDLLPDDRSLLRRGHDLTDILAAQSASGAAIIRRVVSELITNAVKHGEGDVLLDVDDDAVRVSNVIAGTSAVPGTGIGTAGAALLLEDIGGSLSAERLAGTDRWRATVTLPRVFVEGVRHA
ncbi:MAG TPA: hypothetical protein H9769_12905 [Candidatus Microbacterium pullistercoris]|nr:hypothetical protein [Candidatus Microbacterium pullistercoris]